MRERELAGGYGINFKLLRSVIVKTAKSVFICSECGYQSAKWVGKCQSCGSWNTMEETVLSPEPSTKRASVSAVTSYAQTFAELETPEYMRVSTGMGELDRVLGGGLVSGSVVLLSGEPGIGKSTLLLQVLALIGEEHSVLYISGEESRGQLKMRAQRLDIKGDGIYVFTETNIDSILSEIDRLHPEIVIIDSIQTMYTDSASSVPGSITQVKESASRIMGKAKNDGISVIMVGHVNKEGGIAGPKVLEHMVDAVLYFEGERQLSYRIIRAVKNRFGSTNEIGVFEMTDMGLTEIPNPSEMLLADRPKNVSGNCAVCVMEGSRPVIAEVQALATPTVFVSPKRTSNGIDYNRLYLLLAVMEKRLGLKFSTSDVYVNVVGGLRLDEPATDIAIILALISSLKDIPLSDELIAVGEIGLAGEFRAVSNIEQRISESARLGFSKIIVPKRNYDKIVKKSADHGIEVIPAKSIFDVLNLCFGNKK